MLLRYLLRPGGGALFRGADAGANLATVITGCALTRPLR